jgi:CHASE1-domain containing sensor protein
MELLLIAVCLAFTVGISLLSAATTRENTEIEFRRLAEDGVQVLATRMQTYLQSLYGAAALLKASDETTTQDFDTFVSSLDIDTFLPGISGIGLIVPVDDSDLDTFVAQLRKEGRPNFEIRKRTGATEHYILKFVSPTAPNAAALGLDVTFEPERRRVLEEARDTRTARLTPPITLVQHDVALSGFLWLLPVFENDAGGAFTGWVYAPFVAQNLLASLTPYHNVAYRFELFEQSPEGLKRPVLNGAFDAEDSGAFEVDFGIERFGSPSAIAFKSTPIFDASFKSSQPAAILVTGLLLTTMLIFLLRIHPDDLHVLESADLECIDGVTTRSISECKMSFYPREWRWMRSDVVIVERDENGRAPRSRK